MKDLALAALRFYQAAVSPTLPSSCRYYPTCSAYAYEAVEKWGLKRGLMLALSRLVRCRPFGGFGWDPVPAADERPGLEDEGPRAEEGPQAARQDWHKSPIGF